MAALTGSVDGCSSNNNQSDATPVCEVHAVAVPLPTASPSQDCYCYGTTAAAVVQFLPLEDSSEQMFSRRQRCIRQRLPPSWLLRLLILCLTFQEAVPAITFDIITPPPSTYLPPASEGSPPMMNGSDNRIPTNSPLTAGGVPTSTNDNSVTDDNLLTEEEEEEATQETIPLPPTATPTTTVQENTASAASGGTGGESPSPVAGNTVAPGPEEENVSSGGGGDDGRSKPHCHHVHNNFGTHSGYDQPGGTDPMCWKTTFDGNDSHMYLELLPTCGGSQVLTVELPSDDWLQIHQSYDYQVHLELDLLQFGVGNGMEIAPAPGQQQQQSSSGSIALQILLCRVGQVSFCSPFVPEQMLLAVADDGSDTERPYFDSEWIYLNVPDNATSIQETILVPTIVDQVGSYFVLASLRFVTTTAAGDHPENITTSLPSGQKPHVRWDMANALMTPDHRVVQYWEPPEIMQVSDGARITSYVAVALASCVLLALMYQTMRHRRTQVLHLSQAGFLILFLVAALWATLSTVLLEPKNDLYCQLSSPMILIPLQVMYSITIGRLWRINAVISPLLVEHFRKTLKNQRWTGKLVSWIHRQTAAASGSSRRSVQLRRTVTSQKLALVISMFAIPQVMLQVCALIFQPQELILDDGGMMVAATAMCQSTNVENGFGNILYYGYAVLALLLCMLLIMAYSCRNLPSLFNETHVIYTIIFRTFVFIVFGAILVVVLQTQQDSVIAPDITYLLWLTVILYITLASSLGLLLPKLRMVWKGEVVIVSKLVSDHHRARRDKAEARKSRGKQNSMANVTGIDLSQSNNTTDSYLNGSYNTEAYLNGSFLTGSFNAGEFPGSAEVSLGVASNPGKPRLSDIREHSGVSNTSLPVTSSANSESSNNSWLPTTSSDVHANDDDDEDNICENPFDEEAVPARSSSSHAPLGEWRSRMKSIRDKWGTGRSSQFLMEDSQSKTNNNNSRPSSDVLPTRSTAAEDDEENNNSQLLSVSEHNAARVNRRGGDRRQEYRRKNRQRSNRGMMVVSPDETPPRRLVMKMVDQQDCLTSITTKIMSGLSVRPDEWDKLIRLHTILERCLQEEVSFSWREENKQRQEPRMPLLQQINRTASTRSIGLGDLDNHGDVMISNKSRTDDDDDDRYSDAGNSRDETLRRSNTQLGGSYHKSFGKLSHVAREFRRIVECRDRRYGLSTYKNCFVGSHAVDAMIYSGLVQSREEGVEVGRRLAEELHLFRHVTGDHEFKDKMLFYEYFADDDSDCSSCHGDGEDGEIMDESIQLYDIKESNLQSEARAFRDAIKVKDRWYHLKLYPKVFVGCEAVDALLYHGVAKTRWEAVQLGRKLSRELRLFKHSHDEHEFRDEWLFYRFSELDENGVDSSLGSALSDAVVPKSEIAELADAFEMYVDIRDRWYHTKKYKCCFIGSEAVDAMIYAGLASSRDEAVVLGCRLEKELRLFHHVCNDHSFKDSYLFYTFRRRGTKLGNRLGDSDNDSFSSSDRGRLAHGSKSSDSQSEQHTKFSNLRDKAAAFRQCAFITTGTWRMKKYANVFIGCDTVDRMVYTGMAQNRVEAVQLGRAIARELRLFSHVANDHAFSDRYLFYRFHFDDESRSAGSISTNTLSKHSNVPRSIPGAADSHSNDLSFDTSGRSVIAEKADVFKSLAVVKDRKYRLKTYKSCFVGSQVVDALVEKGVVETREAAVEYGRCLESEIRLFHHVCDAHRFRDDHLFYRFRDMGFKEGVDVLGSSLNSANELSISSTIGGDFNGSHVDYDDEEGGGRARVSAPFGLPVLDENSELNAADACHTRTKVRIDGNGSSELPDLIGYNSIDKRPPEESEFDASVTNTPTLNQVDYPAVNTAATSGSDVEKSGHQEEDGVVAG